VPFGTRAVGHSASPSSFFSLLLGSSFSYPVEERITKLCYGRQTSKPHNRAMASSDVHNTTTGPLHFPSRPKVLATPAPASILIGRCSVATSHSPLWPVKLLPQRSLSSVCTAATGPRHQAVFERHGPMRHPFPFASGCPIRQRALAPSPSSLRVPSAATVRQASPYRSPPSRDHGPEPLPCCRATHPGLLLFAPTNLISIAGRKRKNLTYI
jgi:hypothetical protein